MHTRKRARQLKTSATVASSAAPAAATSSAAAATTTSSSTTAAAAAADSPTSADCGICFESQYKFRGSLDCCKHLFCFDCIKTWSSSSNTCPQCKRRIKQIAKLDSTSLKVLEKVKVVRRDLHQPFPAPPPHLANFGPFHLMPFLFNGGGFGDDDDDEEEDEEDDFDGDDEWDEDVNILHNMLFPFLGQFGIQGEGEEEDEDFFDEEDGDDENDFCENCNMLEEDCTCGMPGQTADDPIDLTLDSDEEEE